MISDILSRKLGGREHALGKFVCCSPRIASSLLWKNVGMRRHAQHLMCLYVTAAKIAVLV